MERRRAARYRLEMPAVFRWEDPPGVTHEGRGVTRDVSVESAFVVTATCPPLACRVDVEIIVSSSQSAPRAWLEGIMKVLRLEHAPEGECGFSMAGEAFALCAQ